MSDKKFFQPIHVPYITLGEVAGSAVQLRVISGAPTDGTSGTAAGQASIGSLLIDTTNNVWYINGGTKASPVWEPAGGGVNVALGVRNETGSTIEDGDLVFLSGWNETEARMLISLADADVQGAPAEYIIRTDIETAANGLAFLTYRETGGIDLVGKTVGDPLFLSTTAGDATVTDPTDGDPNALSQVVGRVAIVATDVTEYDLSKPFTQIGTNEIQDQAINSAKIEDLTIVDGDISASAALTRAKLAQEDLARFRIPLNQFRIVDAMHTNLPGTAAAANMALIGGTHATAPPTLEGVIATGSATETQNARVTVSLPENYVAGETVTIRVLARTSGGQGEGTKTLDCIVELNDEDGTTTNVTATSPQTITDSFVNKDFTVTPTALVAGSELDILLTSVIQDSGVDGKLQILSVDLLCDIKG